MKNHYSSGMNVVERP